MDKEYKEALVLANVKKLRPNFDKKVWDVNAIDPTNRHTAMMIAIIAGNISVVKLLLSYNIDLSAVDSQGSNALHCAAYVGRTDIAEMLIEEGIEVDALNFSGASALMSAVSKSRLETALFLISKGAQNKIMSTADGSSGSDIFSLFGCVSEQDGMPNPSYKQNYNYAGYVSVLRQAYEELNGSIQSKAPVEAAAPAPVAATATTTATALSPVSVPAAVARVAGACSNPACPQPSTAKAPLTCGRCKKAHYCDKDCQKVHWKKTHKKECVAPI